ncbi:hypothetical protein COCOBI_19-1780 [Coccomyxa sp. Obi]|nr:hypothetical protein COCOBI_19-1780 [Coccomyxa sp. Obi]
MAVGTYPPHRCCAGIKHLGEFGKKPTVFVVEQCLWQVRRGAAGGKEVWERGRCRTAPAPLFLWLGNARQIAYSYGSIRCLATVGTRASAEHSA